MKEFYEMFIKESEKLLKSGIGDKEKIEKDISNFKIGIKRCEYGECKHLWVSLPDEEGYDSGYYGCVKCGFNNGFIPKFDVIYEGLNAEEKASFGFMTMSILDNPGTYSESCCDLELGKAIYKKIRLYHPGATDEQASDYLSYALYKMRTKDQSEKRKASRVKRLELNHDFNAWNPEIEQDQ